MNYRSAFRIMGLLFLSGQGFSGLQAQETADAMIIPVPVLVIKAEGTFAFPGKARIGYSHKELAFTAGTLKDFYALCTNRWIETKYCRNRPDKCSVFLTLDPSLKSDEGYQLKVDSGRITVTGKNPQGVFYGVQSLSQILLAGMNSGGEMTIPCMQITDYPRFPWRGLHLDVSRHFFDTEFIKKYIDMLALLKMNTFHWHLVDDQGWRIEIKKYPRLTKVGAWRVNHEDMPWNDRPEQQPGEKATFGGFYTRNEIKEIVAYAAQRFVTIVPEIEMPAHVSSALAAYPEYSCKQVPITVPPGSIWPCTNIYCAGNDSTFLFLQNVLTEVMELFPSKYIHVGGDEAEKTEWKACPRCQARIREENLKDENELQSYFIRRIDKFLTEKGRILIGWDEILQGGLAENATVMSWQGTEGGIAAAKMKHNVVMTPGTHCYFDYYQSLDKDVEPLAIGGFTSLETVYSYEPVPEVLTAEEAKHILGAQGNHWTEYMPVGSQVEYMALPRALALSEVVWSPAVRKDYSRFLGRLENQLNLLYKKGYNYYVPTVEGLHDTTAFSDTVQVNMANPYPFGEIHYTVDGSEPSGNSPLYREPLILNRNATIKAAVFLRNGRSGKVKTGRFFKE
jgi:hexosaminidase